MEGDLTTRNHPIQGYPHSSWHGALNVPGDRLMTGINEKTSQDTGPQTALRFKPKCSFVYDLKVNLVLIEFNKRQWIFTFYFEL